MADRTIVALAELHLPGSVHPFPAGAELALPEAHAAELVAAGVAAYTPAPEAAPASEPAPAPEPAPEAEPPASS